MATPTRASYVLRYPTRLELRTAEAFVEMVDLVSTGAETRRTRRLAGWPTIAVDSHTI